MLKSYQVQPTLFVKFLYDDEGTAFYIIAKIIGIGKDNMLHLKHDSDDYVIPLSNCRGVDLNENYIFAFGFESVQHKKLKEKLYSISIDNFTYFIEKDLALGYCLYVGNSVNNRLSFIKKTKYVHELQSSIILLIEKTLKYKPLIAKDF